MHDERPAVFTAVYTQPYNEVVQPGQVWKISKYFLRRWTPYLTPSQVWLVIGARQLSYFNQRRPWFRAYDKALAQAAGQHVKVFRRTTKKEIVAGTSPIATFLSKEADPVYYRDDIVTRQSETRYRVRLDDPLTPGDAAALAYWLRRHCPERITAATVHDLLREAAQLPAYLLRAADPSPAPVEAPGLLSVADVVAYVFSAVGEDSSSWCEAADALHTHIVAPEHAHFELQYFRRRWLAELGPGPALLLTYLRSLCYYNEDSGEIRDEITLQTGDLEAVFQVSSRTLRRWFHRLEEAAPAGNLLGAFFATRDSVKQPDQKVATTYWINLKTPLVAADLETYRQRLADGACREETDEKFPTGQRPDGRKVPHSIGGDGQKVPNDASGDGRKVPHTATPGGQQVPYTRRGDGQKVGAWGTKEGGYKYYRTLAVALGKDSIAKFLEEIPTIQQYAWHTTSGRAIEPFAAVAAGSVKDLLATLDIQEPARGQILALGVSLDEAMAWTLYTLQEPGLDHPAGYLVRRLRAGDSPPPAFLQLARMTWEQWRAYAAACYLFAPPEHLPFADDAAFVLWREHYGSFRPAELPFDLGAGLADLPPLFTQSAPTSSMDAGEAVAPADRALWRHVLDELSLQMTQTTFNSWLRDAHLLAREGEQFVVAVRDDAARDWLEHRLQEPIVRTLRTIAEEPAAAVRFVAPPP
ncbi:MAG: hypothetical protein RRC07_06280 [Anaerolineae bacterium]|nr:hypothetical protein [Anaerolineae bacterium]